MTDVYDVIRTDYDGVELCCECGLETGFIYNPERSTHIVCEHCGTKQMPCSLCDADRGCSCGSDETYCRAHIIASLINYSIEWEKELN